MELTVESITGRRTKLIDVSPSETIRSVKTRLWRIDGVPMAQQSLVYRSQALEDDRTLEDYGIATGAVVKLILITRAGPINKRVDLYTKKPAPTPRNETGTSTPANFPGTSSVRSGQRHDENYLSSASAVRRYTRQQMRQAQMTATHFVGKGHSQMSGDPLSSDMEQQSSSMLDLTLTPERQIASARRADENLRTMQRMRELRRSIERLNLEKSQQKQAQQRNSVAGATMAPIAETGPPRSRRPTGGSGTGASQGNGTSAFSSGTQKSRSSTQLLASSNDRHSAAAAAARMAYAADDTSAKESSAGETEMEDVGSFHQLSGSAAAASANKQQSLTVVSATKIKAQSNQQLMPPPGFKSKLQLYRNIRRSSCSDVDVESSAVWSSDADVDAVFHNDQNRDELFTADDLSFEDDELNVVNGRQEDVQKIGAVIDSSDDYEDANGDYDRRLDSVVQSTPMVDERNSSSAEDDPVASAEGIVVAGLRGAAQDVSSDPSELSSGVVICEMSMALNNRRMKVKRKSYHTPRHSNKRSQAPGGTSLFRAPGTAAVDETDDQSPLESPVKCGNVSDAVRLFPSRFIHHGTASYRDHLHTGYLPTSGIFGGGAANRNWHRARPRSKQRLSTASTASANNDQQSSTMLLPTPSGQQQAAAHNSTTTGDSSSDEREDTVRRDSQNNMGSTVALSASTGGRSAVYGHKPPQSSQSQQRCNACACRLSVATTFHCRCGKTVCLRHRHADLHACTLLTAAAVSEKK